MKNFKFRKILTQKIMDIWEYFGNLKYFKKMDFKIKTPKISCPKMQLFKTFHLYCFQIATGWGHKNETTKNN